MKSALSLSAKPPSASRKSISMQSKTDWARLKTGVQAKMPTPERVNDFATPCVINLLCRVVLFRAFSFPRVVG